jgi:predicted HTH domain antitoxin
MSLTLPELCDKLKDIDEVTLLELLNINSEQLVELAIDLIEEKADALERLFDDDYDEVG